MIVWPGLRRSVSAIQRLFNGASFSAPLTHSAIPTRAASGTTGTFTRATTATVRDNEGVLRTAIAGEARFEGARRVYNECPTSSASIAVAANKTITATVGVYIFSMGAGTGTITFTGTATGSTGTLNASASGRTSKVLTITVAGTIIATASVATCVDIQFENITGRADQTTPSEYVSVGALDYRSTNDPLYLSLPGTAGHYASTPDSAAFPTDDIEVVLKVTGTDWTPAAESVLLNKYGAAGQRSFIVSLLTDGKLRIYLSSDGTAVVNNTTSVGTGFADGSTGYIKVTRTKSDGVVTVYTSTDGVTYSALGTTFVLNAGQGIFDSTAGIQIGAEAAGTLPFGGKIFSVQIYSTIGGTTPVVDFNPHRDATTPTGTITSSTTGEVWTINGASSVVRSDYYHGSMVDGVKCFPTDLSGNPIAASINTGYVAEGARTNLCLQSQTFGTTWTQTNITVSSDATTAPDGTLTADSILETVAAGAHAPRQSITTTVAAWTFSVYAKPNGRTWLLLDANTFGGGAYFNLSGSGSVGTLTTSGLTATITSLINGWYRCSITKVATATTDQFSAFFATGDGVFSYAGDITKGFYLWGAQVELGSFASSYIPTTTIAVARNADVLTYSSSGNIDATKGWAYAEVTTSIVNAAASVVAIAGNNATDGYPMYLSSSTGKLSLWDETAVRGFGTPTIPVTTPVKFSTTWGGTTSAGAISGAVVSGAFDGDLGVSSTFGVGATNNGLAQLEGTIRNVRIGQRQLSSSELGAITQ